MFYADTVGLANVLRAMRAFARGHQPDAWVPAPLLQQAGRARTAASPEFGRKPAMTDAVVVSTARTGLAKSWRGSLNMTHPVTFTGHVLRHAIERARIDPAEVEDVHGRRDVPRGRFGRRTSRGRWRCAPAARSPPRASRSTASAPRDCRPSRSPRSVSWRAKGRSTRPAAWNRFPAFRTNANTRMLQEHWMTRAQARGVLEHAADRRERRQALPHRSRKPRTSTACAASCARPRRRRRDSSTTRSCPMTTSWRSRTRAAAPSARRSDLGGRRGHSCRHDSTRRSPRSAPPYRAA